MNDVQDEPGWWGGRDRGVHPRRPPPAGPGCLSRRRTPRRVVRPGGALLLAFQAGQDIVHLTHAYGHDIDLQTRRQDPAAVRGRLDDAGFELLAEFVTQPVPPQKSPQWYVLARRRS